MSLRVVPCLIEDAQNKIDGHEVRQRARQKRQRAGEGGKRCLNPLHIRWPEPAMLKKICRVNCDDRDQRDHREMCDVSGPRFSLPECLRNHDAEVDHDDWPNQQH